MSITHTATQKTLNARELINEQIAAYLERGGSITEIPRGQSVHNLQIRPVEDKNRGTRRCYADPKMNLQSAEGKASSIRQRQAREKSREALRKNAEALNEAARARRQKQMPKVRQMLAEGKSRREIGKVIGVAHGTINYWLKLERSTDGE
ncbi:hypothetical protein [Microbulbifer celer]|uniref:Transcriptional regulator SutA RNAP-binding domain-containing protein n=1 Tax=Microbulbifer celer TaxID=435905 RepID=A0ABW3U7H4_9GAMM|nr:hypothetical protein [Microbulbifer celer]UFN58563.1 hypothetical protein LPW13_05840 [Microbulbifer celer]